MQTAIFQKIRDILPTHTSLTAEISSILDCSYDAAYRRVANKTSLSLEEATMLARYFDFSIDELYAQQTEAKLMMERSADINNPKELEGFLRNSIETMKSLSRQGNLNIIYSAKDLPIFYTASFDSLFRLKLYVWLKLLDHRFNASNISFDDFKPPVSRQQFAEAIGKVYDNASLTEIWNNATINSTLQQIHYYFDTKLLSAESAMAICDDMTELVKSVEDKVAGTLNKDNPRQETYKLYTNDSIIIYHYILAQAEGQKHLYVPFSLLNYLKTSDQGTCEAMQVYSQKMLHSSRLLSDSDIRDRTKFFGKMYNKISHLKKHLQSTNQIDYL